MFGINDNNPQTANSFTAQPTDHADAPANPFSEGDTPMPVIPPPAGPAVVTMPGTPTVAPEPVHPSNTIATTAGDDDLLGLKQQALQNLQPLVSHLDQSPQEKFRTTMMLIQATDNSALVKQAYEAANQITDEKTRAQALLDVVNEINYFTQPHGGEPETKV
jgi:hypothetical protein